MSGDIAFLDVETSGRDPQRHELATLTELADLNLAKNKIGWGAVPLATLPS
jgi:hypothetical protein